MDPLKDSSPAGTSLTDDRFTPCMPARSTFSRFLSLPPEIRHEVYKLLFVRRSPINPFSYRECSGQAPSAPRHERCRGGYRPCKSPLNLLVACRQVHDEAIAIMYGWNTFRIPDEGMTPSDAGNLHRFIHLIGDANLSRVRHVELALDASNDATSQGHEMFRDANDHLFLAIISLVVCFDLRILTLTFYYSLSIYRFSFVFDGSIGIDKERALQKLKIEISATIKAFERCRL